MPSVFFRYKVRYLIDKELFNVQFPVEDAKIEINEKENVTFNACAEDYEGERRSFLCITIITEDNNQGIYEVFEKTRLLVNPKPAPIDEIVQEKIHALGSKANNLLRLFRWLTNLPFSLELRGKGVPVEWSLDEINWLKIPHHPLDIWEFISAVGDEVTNVVDNKLIHELIEPNLHRAEPLGFDLLTEARRLLLSNNLRGAFAIGYSALEVGVKEFIQFKVPETSWLLLNTSSPDILKVCTKYLPSLDERLDIKKSLERRLIDKYMQSRNVLIHTGILNENFETINKKLYMVEYMLLMFDYCSGLDLAFKYAQRVKGMMEVGREDLNDK